MLNLVTEGGRIRAQCQRFGRQRDDFHTERFEDEIQSGQSGLRDSVRRESKGRDERR